MMTNGGVLISQDLSCAGQVSSSVALPILGASGMRPTLLPTAILSTHTGFKDNTYLDLSGEMPKIVEHWRKNKINFDALYLGYLGKNALDFWLQNVDQLKRDEQVVLIDPAMADHGKMYRGLDEEYVAKMQKLISKATILTPNITEAAFLLDKDLTEVTLEKAQEFANELTEEFAIPNVIITGISISKEKIGEVGITENKNWSLIQEKLPGSFFGTGDMFASAFLAAVIHGNNLEKSCSIAADFIRLAIMNTDQDPLFGPNYAAGMPWLLQELEKQELQDEKRY